MVIVREVWTRGSMDLRRSMRAEVREIRALLRAISPARHALVRDRHRSREFIEFLKLLDATYPTSTALS